MKVLAFVGSIREDSYNLGIVKTLQERYSDKMNIQIADLASLPFYDESIENEPGEIVENFKKEVKEADAILIATPEYNWSIPGVLKNALDWLSRVDFVLRGKPVLVIGASKGVLGTIRAQLHLRQILSSPGLNARLLPPAGNEILVGVVHEKFEDGRLVHEPTLEFIDDVMDRFMQFVQES